MLSTLPKLADKAFIIGFLLPVIMFLAALLFLFSDLASVAFLLKLIADANNVEKIIYIALVVWSLAICVMMANQRLYQIAEGYRWPVSKIPRTWEIRRFETKRQRLKFLGQQWKVAGDSREYDDLLFELVRQFPSEQGLILPTRFGNAIRAFEDYSRHVYGADSIPLWIHLCTVIPRDFQAAVENTRAQVTFLFTSR